MPWQRIHRVSGLVGKGLHSGRCKCDSEKVVMAKHTTTKPDKGLTKKQIAVSRRQQEQNRKLLDEKRVASIMDGTPMNRYGEPDELIGALLLLVSPKAGSFITGIHVNVDGGFTAAWF